MPIPAPAIRWPAEFDEQGPAEDPTIILTGEAEIGGVFFEVTALRMRDNMRTPDYLDDVPETVYRATIDSMVEDIEDLVGSIEPELIVIRGKQYMLWMVPPARE